MKTQHCCQAQRVPEHCDQFIERCCTGAPWKPEQQMYCSWLQRRHGSILCLCIYLIVIFEALSVLDQRGNEIQQHLHLLHAAHQCPLPQDGLADPHCHLLHHPQPEQSASFLWPCLGNCISRESLHGATTAATFCSDPGNSIVLPASQPRTTLSLAQQRHPAQL